LIVDLGGIAKGFAVDRAVEALKDNASRPELKCCVICEHLAGFAFIHLRHPAEPTRIAGAVRLRERAMRFGIYSNVESIRAACEPIA